MDLSTTSNTQAHVDGADLIEQARAMIPFLREMDQQTTALRRPPEETRLRLKASGFSRIFQPRRYGGAEGNLVDGVEILRSIGQGCGSTAWIVVQNILHNLMLANWPRQAQDEVWGSTPDVLISGILIPGIGKATKVDGGFQLSGRWPFVSGVEIADWVIFTGDCISGEEKEERHFILHKDQIKILDTWYTIGLRGSSSQDVLLERVFVPEHMTVTDEQLKGHGRSPGSKLNTSWHYQIPAYALFGAFIGTAALGIAEAAVDHYIENARKRVSTMTGNSLASYATQQVKVAEAKAAVLTARQLITSVVQEAQDIFQNGGTSTVEDRTRWRALATFAGRLSTSAVNLVLEAGGGGVIYERNPIARYFTDMTVANRHITQNWDFNGSMYGRVLLGLPAGLPPLED